MTGWLLAQRKNADPEDVDRARALAAALDDADLVHTSDTDGLDEVIRGLNGRALLMVGGDGSINLAVNRLDAAGLLGDVTLGVLPAGTGNDLASTLGVEFEVEGAAAALRAGRTCPLDVLRVSADGQPRGLFVNALHTGVGVTAARNASDLKNALGNAAYPVGSLAAGIVAEGWSVDVTVDGQALAPSDSGPALLVGVANGRTVGGGHPLAPAADPGDGRCDIIVSHASGPADRVAFGVALARGSHVDRDDVAVATGAEVVLEGRLPGMNVDGDLWDALFRRVEIRVDPAAVRMVVPWTP